MQSYEDYDPEIVVKKLYNLEREMIDLHERYLTLAETVKTMQHYMVRMAQQQATIATQLSHWPYIAVERQSKSKKDKE
jgi:hypothetical protein